jgi:hypothetical protein
MVDNPGLLQLDIVWCMFKQGDATRLACATERLRSARQVCTRDDRRSCYRWSSEGRIQRESQKKAQVDGAGEATDGWA